MRSVCHTLLFVPGDRPSRIENAFACGAHGVAVDLEDAVAESAKDAARATAVQALQQVTAGTAAVLVRVNAMTTPHAAADVSALAPILDRVDAVVLPKAESAAEVHLLADLLERAERDRGLEPGATRILATTETAAGVLAATEIAAASARVWTLLFGSADLSNELGVTPTPEGTELLVARSTVVLAAAAAGLTRPLDGPYLRLDDEEGLRVSAAGARGLGFGGKAVIHPAQLATVAHQFAPTEAELAWAAEVSSVFNAAEQQGRGTARLPDGTFIDYPVAHRARAILRAGRCEEAPR